MHALCGLHALEWILIDFTHTHTHTHIYKSIRIKTKPTNKQNNKTVDLDYTRGVCVQF